ncbi:hypothetical protein [Bailinhaonella thermotolerans]|uniref:Uncharacterized protein n=1 Tax=Bailinhaonella thermotolerans TaxID=1070861 RepID=A0A3A4BA38_9ACTN|nr:hypothetical protein [Bailinhaonella thermotolerans]RJL35433.1 hypothetical protein D5H75_01050 [Bailinhaonella thermotolerans]
MSTFTDALMLRLHAPGGLPGLLFPADATGRARIRQLAGTLYGVPAAALHDVLKVEVAAEEYQWPLFRQRLLAGTWTRTTPDHARTDVLYEGREAGAPPEWVDLALEVAATVLLELDGGRIESVVLGDIGEYASLAEFQAKFRWFDLAGYLARHGLTTVEDLRRAFHHLLGEVKLAAPPPFDPADPANQRRLRLRLAVLIRETVDVTEALRSARLVRDLAARGQVAHRDPDGLTSRSPLAPVLLLPKPAVTAHPVPESELLAFFASQDVLAIPVPP